MRLALVISSLAGGGAERAMAGLANASIEAGHEVTVITLAPRSEDRYPLRAEIERVELGLMRDSHGFLSSVAATVRRIRGLRRALARCRPDAAISFLTATNLLVLVATARLDVPVIVCERSSGAQPLTVAQRVLYRILYRRAAAVVAQTNRGASELALQIGRPVRVIPNSVEPGSDDTGRAPSASPPPPVAGDPTACVVLGVGRLSVEKGFDLLIDAFARVAARHPAWRLTIAGEGPARGELTAQITARGLTGRVLLPGFTSSPRAVMRAAHLFVLPSRFEGMPNALIEAMAEGLACIGFDCRTGPAELIDHGVNGWLVPAEDVSALADALELLMKDPGMRARLGAQASAVRDKYSPHAILELWRALLADVTGAAKA
jgi:glycosyltransferase involved in cell wall biosynthesis